MTNLEFFKERIGERHNERAVSSALLRLSGKAEMQKFQDGYAKWFERNGDMSAAAKCKADCNIGHSLYFPEHGELTAGRWTKFMWILLGVGKSRITYYF